MSRNTEKTYVPRTVRIFISSPGDVADERERARQVVEQLRRRYAGRLDLKTILWENLPLQADMSFQQAIDLILSEKGVDIAVFILWSRLGSPIGSVIRKPDGAEYRSGTERELDLMLKARELSGRNHPDILVYTRADDSSFDERLRGKTTGEKENLIAQKKLLEQFIREEFHDPERGTNIRAYHSFNAPNTFSQRLFTHLQDILDSLAGGAEGRPIWNIELKGAPFRGLEVFEFRHADVFFGREAEILELRHILGEQARNGCAFVLISGASGSGKSSLLRAGVIPAILADEIDESIAGWRQVVFSPGQAEGNLLRGLARALMGGKPVESSQKSLDESNGLPELWSDSQALDDLADGLRKNPEITFRLRIKQALQKAAEGRPGAIRMVILVDQLEELFTDKRITDGERVAFVRALDALARSGSVWVMATVRNDFYGHCQRLPMLMTMKGNSGQFDVPLPGSDALHRLITEPARLAGLKFEEREGKTLDRVILDDAARHPELLPLLEYLLLELFKARSSDNELTFAAYESFARFTRDGEKLGGIRGALAKRAEETYRQINPGAVAFDSVMNALVTISGDDEESAVRQYAPKHAVTDTPEKENFVNAFIEVRLFTAKGSDAVQQTTVSVAHEALLRVWPKAAEWVKANKEFLRVRAQIEQRIRQSGVILPGDPLFDRAKFELAINRDLFDKRQISFIEKAVADADKKEKRARKIRKTVILSLSILTIASILGMCWAIHSSMVQSRRCRTIAKLMATKLDKDSSSISAGSMMDKKELSLDISDVRLIHDLLFNYVREFQNFDFVDSKYIPLQYELFSSAIVPLAGMMDDSYMSDSDTEKIPAPVLDFLCKCGMAEKTSRLNNGGFLHLAVFLDAIDAVETIIKEGTDVNLPNMASRTPIFYAQSEECVKKLLEHGADINVYFEIPDPNIPDKKKNIRPLTFFLKLKRPDIAKILIEAGSKVGVEDIEMGKISYIGDDNQPRTMLQLMTDNGVDIGKVIPYVKELPLLEILLASGGDVNSLIPETKESVLHKLNEIRFEDALKLLPSLLSAGVNINAKNNSGDTPLHLAFSTGNLKYADWLLGRGADLNAPNNDGETPLQKLLAFNPQESIFQSFANNADANRERKAVFDKELAALLPKLFSKIGDLRYNLKSSNALLSLSVREGSEDIARKLIENGADVKTAKIGDDPITDYVMKHYDGNTMYDINFLRYLVSKGGKVEYVDLCQIYEHPELMEFYDESTVRARAVNEVLEWTLEKDYVGWNNSIQPLLKKWADSHWKSSKINPPDSQNIVRKKYRQMRDWGILHWKDGVLDISGEKLAEYLIALGNEEIVDMLEHPDSKCKFDENVWISEIVLLDGNGNHCHNKTGVAIYKFKHSKCGKLLEMSYYDESGTPCNGSRGIAKFVRKYDESGKRCVEESNFDANGKLCNDIDGVATFRNRFDEKGYCIEKSMFDSAGKPCLDKSENTSILRWKYDDQHNRTEQSCFDTAGEPCLFNNVHMSKWKYDDKGNVLEARYFGVDGKPCANSLTAAAMRRCKYDERDNMISEEYFDVSGKLCLNKDGAAKTEWKYNELDEIVEILHSDLEGKLIKRSKKLKE